MKISSLSTQYIQKTYVQKQTPFQKQVTFGYGGDDGLPEVEPESYSGWSILDLINIFRKPKEEVFTNLPTDELLEEEYRREEEEEDALGNNNVNLIDLDYDMD